MERGSTLTGGVLSSSLRATRSDGFTNAPSAVRKERVNVSRWSRALSAITLFVEDKDRAKVL